MTPQLVRAGRALINMRQSELSAKCMISSSTLNTYERERTSISARIEEAIFRTLQDSGVVFFHERDHFIGVRYGSRAPQENYRLSINAGQIRAARSLLGITQSKLSELSRVGLGTICKIEIDVAASRNLTIKSIKDSLIEAGVEFLQADNQHGPGVALKLDQ